MDNVGDGGVLAEINRLLDAFVRAHGHSSALQHLEAFHRSLPSPTSKYSDGITKHTGEFHQDLARLQYLCAFAGSRSLCAVALHLSSWIERCLANNSASPPTPPQIGTSSNSAFEKPFASWLVARLLVAVFDADESVIASADTDLLASKLLEQCFRVFEIEHQIELKRSHHSSTNFFSAFLSSVPVLKHSPISHLAQEGDDVFESDTHMKRYALLQWRQVLGHIARLSLRITRKVLQRELRKPELMTNIPKASTTQLSFLTGGITIPHPYLQFLSELSLGLINSDVANPEQQLEEVALLLKVFFPLLSKPFKSRVRRGAASLVANLLHRERSMMDREQFKNLLARAPVSEWNSCVSGLHALALKLSQKRKALIAGWELRTSVLALAPPDIFGRYWKDDMHALLRLLYKYGKTSGGVVLNNVSGSSGGNLEASASESVKSAILRSVGVSFTNFVLRHLLAERRGGSPTESDCMEIINTAQAWCFFSTHRNKSFARFKSSVVPVLVDLSVAIAAFNMRYAIQSHLRRLLTEADNVVDDKKLVGLEVLLALCRNCSASAHPTLIDAKTKPVNFTLDVQTFMGQLGTLGEIAGHILILCNTLLGHDLLFDQLSSMASTQQFAFLTVDQEHTSNAVSRLLRDENKRLLAVEIFSSALRSLEFVYSRLELRSDQKVLLLARASVHKEEVIRKSAVEALLAVIVSSKFAQAGVIIRGLTDYLVRMASNHAQASDAEPLTLLVRLCGSMLRTAVRASFGPEEATSCWESEAMIRESFLQVEAASVFLLTHDEASVRMAALETLETVRELRATITAYSEAQNNDSPAIVESISALDVIKELELTLKERFFTFQPSGTATVVSQMEEDNELWHFKCLAGNWGDTRHNFRWSMCLASVFPALASELPQLMAYFWTDVNDKVSKLEPVIVPFNDGHVPRFGSASGDISRWRNLSVFATASASQTLVLIPSSNAPKTPNGPANPSSSSRCTTQSAISSAAVAALIKRLGRYLKSASVEQQKAAVIALGATHRSSHALLIDVLSKCDADAFYEVGQDLFSTGKSSSRTESFEGLVKPAPHHSHTLPTNNPPTRRYTTTMAKARNTRVTSQLQAQWALLRCYRLLLESVSANSSAITSPNKWNTNNGGAETAAEAKENELLMSAASSFLVRIVNSLDLFSSSPSIGQSGVSGLLGEPCGYMLFMIQQDFCGAVQLLLKNLVLDREASGNSNDDNNREDGISANDGEERPELHEAVMEFTAIGSFVNKARAVQWVKTLLSWCASFGSLSNPAMAEHLEGAFFSESSPLHDVWTRSCDVFGVRERESGQTLPWLWLDEAVPACFKNSVNQNTNDRRHYHPATLAVASSTRFLRYFTCGCAFSTLTTLITSNHNTFLASDLATSSSPVISWLDECFAIDITRSAAHFSSLQYLCQSAAKKFLDGDCDGVFRSICIDKSCFRRSSGAGYAIAKQYMLALSTQARRISVELLSASNSQFGCQANSWESLLASGAKARGSDSVHFVYALLLHLGAIADPSAAGANEIYRRKVHSFVGAVLPHDTLECERTGRWLGSLTVSVPQGSTALASEVRNRVQVAAASALASSFPSLRLVICIAVFRLLRQCDVFIQRSMLGAVLPLLVDANIYGLTSHLGQSKTWMATSKDEAPGSIDNLLEVMFELTVSISETCAEQLDRAWLTLAYSSASSSIDASLMVIVAFLVKKCTFPTETATAKLIMWWLARWQDAAFAVMSVLCNYVETLRFKRLPSAQNPGENATEAVAATIASTEALPLDIVATFVTLASDASCHLQQNSTQEFKEVVFQAIHFSLLLRFAIDATPTPGETSSHSNTFNAAQVLPLLLLEPSSDAPNKDSPVTTPHIANMSANIHRDCAVLLQTMGEFLNGDRGTLNVSKHPLEILTALAQSLTRDDATVWSEVCVKEIALVLASATSSPPASKLDASLTIQARFAVIVYRLLACEFNGGLFLALLELLHVALDEHLHDPATYEPLICECLTLLAQMVERMTDSKLALYPQVLWVCTALLNHFSTPSAREATLGLLHSLLLKPMLVTNETLTDVILCKRPAQWSAEQSSVLRALVPGLHIGTRRARRMTIEMVAHCALLLPQTLLVVKATERAILCSVGLVPVLASRVSSALIAPAEMLKTVCTDLAAQWEQLADEFSSASAAKSSHEGRNAILGLAAFFQKRARDLQQPRAETDGASGKTVVASFVRAYLPAIRCIKSSGKDSEVDLSLTFDILTRSLSSIGASAPFDNSIPPADREIVSDLDANVFALAEELLIAMETASVQWRPPMAFVSVLALIARQPERGSVWQSAMRLLALVSLEKANTASIR